MRSFAIVLGCLAWVLSCFDAVSYYRAGVQEARAEARLPGVASAEASQVALAGGDATHMRERVAADQDRVNHDLAAQAAAQRKGEGEAQVRQMLAADQAALQADQMMQYTVEDFAKSDPNPEVLRAENKVDIDRRVLADAMQTRARDRSLSHGLAALWVVVAGCCFLAWRGQRLDRATLLLDEDEEDDLEEDKDDLTGDEERWELTTDVGDGTGDPVPDAGPHRQPERKAAPPEGAWQGSDLPR